MKIKENRVIPFVDTFLWIILWGVFLTGCTTPHGCPCDDPNHITKNETMLTNP